MNELKFYDVYIGSDIPVKVYHVVAEDKGMAIEIARDHFHYDYPSCAEYHVIDVLRVRI